MKRLWKETGEVWQQPTGTTGRPRVIGEAHRERLRDYLDRNPDALMRDIADFLNDECGVDVTVSTVWRTMVRLGWKENRPRAKDRDPLGQWKPTLPRDENGKPIYGPVKDRGKQKLPKKKKPTPQEALLNRVQIFVQDYMPQPRFDASHDYSHVLRVVNLSRHILRAELIESPHMRYDQMVVELAALLHDVNDYKYVPQSGEHGPTTAHIKSTSRPTQPDHATTGPSSTPQGGALHLFNDNPSHPPYGQVPPETPSQTTSTTAPSASDQPSHPNVDPLLQPLSNDHTTPSQPLPNNHSTPSHAYPAYQSTQQTAQIQNQLALQPVSHVPQIRDGSRPHRTIEEHLLRLRAPAQLAAAVGQICSAVSFTHETQNPEHAASILSQHPELAIVQDADRLDALGAVGIGRAFTFGGAKGRSLDDTIEHVDEKLVRIAGMMKTAEGRRLARIRSERVNAFRGWWEEEAGMGLGFGGAEVMAGDDGGDSGGSGEQAMDMSTDAVGVRGEAPDDGWPVRGGSAPGRGLTNGFGGPSNGNGIGNGVGHAYGDTSQRGQTQGQGHGQDHPNRQLMMEAGML